MPLLSVENLSIDFRSHRGDVRAVAGVSFAIERGETVAIVGESGSGKSVTAMALLGLLPMPPGQLVSGMAHFQSEKLGDVDLLALSEKQLRQVRGNDIGMIFQEPMTSLNPVLTCGYQVAEALLLHTALSKAQARYSYGVGANLDVLDAETQLAQARLSLAQAMYSYTLGQFQLRRATGEQIWQ